MIERVHTLPDVTGRAGGLAVNIALRPHAGLITLRVDLGNADTAAAVRQATGLPLPEPRQRTGGDARAALWMAPDELLLCVPAEECAATIGRIEETLAGTPHLAADMSDAWAVFRVTGDGTREVLAKGMPVDLHADAFRPGMVRRSHFARVNATICQAAANPDAFDLFCFRSYARYVSECLARFAIPGSLPGVFQSE